MPPSNQFSIEVSIDGSIASNNPADNSVKQCADNNNNKDDTIYTNKLKEIHKALPTSTQAERRRFLIADRQGNTKAATEKLQSYLDWRRQHINDELSHLDPWTYATQIAMNHQAKAKKGKPINDIDVNNTNTTYKLPSPLFMYEHNSITNTSIDSTVTTSTTRMKYIQHLPARIDLTLADNSTYALALALYIDHILDRNSTEKATLVIDVRPGYGWCNIKAIQLLPFIQMVSKLLCDLFPSRLEKCIVYPVPKVALFLWKAVQPFVGTETVDKICLISGSAGKKDKVPTNVSKYLDEDLIAKLEERRTSLFIR